MRDYDFMALGRRVDVCDAHDVIVKVLGMRRTFDSTTFVRVRETVASVCEAKLKAMHSRKLLLSLLGEKDGTSEGRDHVCAAAADVALLIGLEKFRGALHEFVTCRETALSAFRVVANSIERSAPGQVVADPTCSEEGLLWFGSVVHEFRLVQNLHATDQVEFAALVHQVFGQSETSEQRPRQQLIKQGGGDKFLLRVRGLFGESEQNMWDFWRKSKVLRKFLCARYNMC